MRVNAVSWNIVIKLLSVVAQCRPRSWSHCCTRQPKLTV